mgnify:CR=1 FL=1
MKERIPRDPCGIFEVCISFEMEAIFMSNKISRRSFLKGAGVAALAVSAAGALSGCSLVDDIINKATEDYPNMTTLDGVSFNLSGVHAARKDSTYEGSTETLGDLVSFMPHIGLANFVGGEGKSVNKDTFSLKVDDHEMKPLLGDAAMTAAGNYITDKDDLLLDKNGNVTLGANTSESGYKYGFLVYAFPENVPVKTWKKAVLTITMGGKSTTFTLTHKGNPSMDEYDISKK